MSGEMLISQEKYLEAGIHIGTKIKTPDMAPFIYKARQDKLYVLDLKKVDERIRVAAKIIARYEPATVMVVASRTYAANAASSFAKATGVSLKKGRVVPGVFTNPAREDFVEPRLLVVSDPKGERQAIKEAIASGIPVIGLCDTDNSAKFIDWVIPCNNKGKKSLALVYYLLARETLKAAGKISSDEDFKASVEEFEERPEETGPEEAAAGEAGGGEGEVEEGAGEQPEAPEAEPAQPAPSQ
ncbi:MAG: 30S ribosomal protein S2 [Candidatus ainarchaeum sp.]|nr:30S ribosomal protein S2 [Candidatus ainarchaeum sp.]